MKIGGGDKLFTSWKELLVRSERVSSLVGKSIFPGRRKYLSECKEVPSPLLPLGSAALLTAVSTSVEPSGSTLLSYNYNPFSCTVITCLVVRLYTL